MGVGRHRFGIALVCVLPTVAASFVGMRLLSRWRRGVKFGWGEFSSSPYTARIIEARTDDIHLTDDWLLVLSVVNTPMVLHKFLTSVERVVQFWNLI